MRIYYSQKRVEAILPTLSFKNLDDLYIGIANKRVSLQAVVDRLAKIVKQLLMMKKS